MSQSHLMVVSNAYPKCWSHETIARKRNIPTVDRNCPQVYGYSVNPTSKPLALSTHKWIRNWCKTINVINCLSLTIQVCVFFLAIKYCQFRFPSMVRQSVSSSGGIISHNGKLYERLSILSRSVKFFYRLWSDQNNQTLTLHLIEITVVSNLY